MSSPRPLASVQVPASTSNLGPGFDALGLALALYLRVDLLAITEDGLGEVRCAFAGPTPPGDNLIVTGFRAVCQGAGASGVPSLEARVTCEIPACAGLGSSAAALVAGGRLASLVVSGVTDQLLIDVLTRIEGHPDNITAAVLGGLVAGCVEADGHVLAVATPWPDAVRLVIATPSAPLLTRTARAVLPAQVSRHDAVFNIQRVALLLLGVAAGHTEVLRTAFADRLHQPYRLPLVAGLAEVLALQAPGVLGAFLSGAGPSAAVCVEGDPQPAIAALRRIYDTLGQDVTVRVLDAHQPATTSPLAVSHG